MNLLKKMKQLFAAALLVLFITAPALAIQPKFIFYFIGDGLGASQRQFSEFFLREKKQNKSARLLMNTFDVAGMNTTYCADTLITDSAAAATALASGIKTNKGRLGKDVNGKDVRTLTEAARDKGMKTGLISTTRITHATPAAFASHQMTRNKENRIALDLLTSGVDFLAGGGIRHFIPRNTMAEHRDAIGRPISSKRRDDKDLIKGFKEKGYATFIGMQGAKAFKNKNFTGTSKVFAAFTNSHTPYEIERMNKYTDMPSLAAMTRAGIEVLCQGDKGFFLMVEGGRIDHAAHSNDPTGVIWDTLAFDNAVQAAFDFYTSHKNDTLIVVVGDHETGGMGLGMDSMGYKLNMGALLSTRISVQESLSRGDNRYKGNKEAFLSYLAEEYGLSRLSDFEAASLEKAMAAADAGETMGYYRMNPAALTAARLLSRRANINWTTTIHTATMIPMSAAGVGAAKFGGYKDNTEIAKTMALMLGVSL